MKATPTNPIRRNPMRTMLFLAAASMSMAFTIPGCPDMNALNDQMATLEKKVDSQQKAIAEMNGRLSTMNDEHNTMKQLVNQVSTTVLEQKDAVEKLDASVKEMASRRAAPAPAARSARPAAKRRR